MQWGLPSKPLMALMAMGIAASGIGAYGYAASRRPPVLEIYVFSFQSGRSVLVITPEDKVILIDGGSSSEIITEITKVLPFYSRKIDAIIPTSFEGKNVTGLIDVLDRYLVLNAFLNEDLLMHKEDDQIFGMLIDAIGRKGIDAKTISYGDEISFDNSVTMRAIGPLPHFKYNSSTTKPELIYRIDYGKTSFTFLGNSSKVLQDKIADENIKRTDVVYIHRNPSPQNISSKLVSKLKPSMLIFAREKANGAVTSSTNRKQDPFGYLFDDDLFNLKDGYAVKLVSDGEVMTGKAIIKIKK